MSIIFVLIVVCPEFYLMSTGWPIIVVPCELETYTKPIQHFIIFFLPSLAFQANLSPNFLKLHFIYQKSVAFILKVMLAVL